MSLCKAPVFGGSWYLKQKVAEQGQRSYTALTQAAVGSMQFTWDC